MHANLVHLFVNMFGLWTVGRILELIAGSKNTFLLYIIAGITGNIFSFALVPNLSVGASGSLFGILFCLYIAQKYEENVAKELNIQTANVKVGKAIFINIFINIAFGIFAPIFDWAAHLGGAIAGTLFGLGLTTKHRRNLRFILGIQKKEKFLRRIFLHYQNYYIILLLINILFLLSYFKVKKYQKIYGEGIYLAAQNQTIFLKNSELHQYKDILEEQNTETKFENLLNGAYTLHSSGHFFASRILYEVLISLYKNQNYTITDDKLNDINNALNLSKNRQNLTNYYLSKISPISYITNIEEICSKPAELYLTLGYFNISGKLFECAFLLNTHNDDFAIKAVESYELSNNKKEIEEVLEIVDLT